MELEANEFTGNAAADGGNNIFWTNRDDSEYIPPAGCTTYELDNQLCIVYPAKDLRFNIVNTEFT